MGWLLIDNYLVNTRYITDFKVMSSTSIKINMIDASWLTFNGLAQNESLIIEKAYHNLTEKCFFKEGKLEAVLDDQLPNIKIFITDVDQVLFFYYSSFSNKITATTTDNKLIIVTESFTNRLKELASILNSYTTSKPIFTTIEKDFVKPTILDLLKRILRR